MQAHAWRHSTATTFSWRRKTENRLATIQYVIGTRECITTVWTVLIDLDDRYSAQPYSLTRLRATVLRQPGTELDAMTSRHARWTYFKLDKHAESGFIRQRTNDTQPTIQSIYWPLSIMFRLSVTWRSRRDSVMHCMHACIRASTYACWLLQTCTCRPTGRLPVSRSSRIRQASYSDLDDFEHASCGRQGSRQYEQYKQYIGPLNLGNGHSMHGDF